MKITKEVTRVIKGVTRIVVIKLVNIYFRILFKLKYSINKETLLIYTDSRGFLVNCYFCNKTPYKSYIDALSEQYNIEYQLCPYKHTTTLDFLKFIKKRDLKKYSKILLHIGIVDYSPRPLSQMNLVYKKKKKIANELFHKLEMLPNYYESIYEGETTFSLYTLKYLEMILNELIQISKSTPILWLGVNKIDLNWNGNYPKQRPTNINIILEYQNYIKNYLKENSINSIDYIDIDEVNNFELYKHTIDNMHLTTDGVTFFTKIINERLNK